MGCNRSCNCCRRRFIRPPLSRTCPGSAPCVYIEDYPLYSWRGAMLDVARHFFNKQEVKQLVDALAIHKLNTLHLHLVDDQGWRFQLTNYPNVTTIGAWRNGIDYGLAAAGHHRDEYQRTIRRILHASRRARAGGLRAGTAHHHRAGNRNALSLGCRPGFVWAVQLRRCRRLHHGLLRYSTCTALISTAWARPERWPFWRMLSTKSCRFSPANTSIAAATKS